MISSPEQLQKAFKNQIIPNDKQRQQAISFARDPKQKKT